MLYKPISYCINLFPHTYSFQMYTILVALCFEDNNAQNFKYKDSSWDKLVQRVNFQDQVSKFIFHLYQLMFTKQNRVHFAAVFSIKSKEKLFAQCVYFEVYHSCIFTMHVIFLCHNHGWFQKTTHIGSYVHCLYNTLLSLHFRLYNYFVQLEFFLQHSSWIIKLIYHGQVTMDPIVDAHCQRALHRIFSSYRKMYHVLISPHW